MIFEPINYLLLLDDIIYSVAAGFVVGFINQILGVFFYKGRIRLFIKDIFVSIIFATVMFSFVVSFANYSVVRFYHVFGGLLGFLCFTPAFSKLFNKIFSIVFSLVKQYILLCFKRIYNIGCVLALKTRKGRIKKEKSVDKKQLPSDNIMVYNQ